jgi:hypothetical protein
MLTLGRVSTTNRQSHNCGTPEQIKGPLSFPKTHFDPRRGQSADGSFDACSRNYSTVPSE